MTKHGDPSEFLKKVLLATTDDCIVWPYSTSCGYGYLRVNGRNVRVHRHVLALISGGDQPDFHACHSPGICHKRSCINPRHLRWATKADNEADKVIDGTSNRGERQGRSKLTELDVLAIREDGRKLSEIASDYGISIMTVSEIRRRITWTWL